MIPRKGLILVSNEDIFPCSRFTNLLVNTKMLAELIFSVVGAATGTSSCITWNSFVIPSKTILIGRRKPFLKPRKVRLFLNLKLVLLKCYINVVIPEQSKK